ncbi:MAG: hypothetical protein IT305_19485 [Chloroflexi bacterium]|nr:hypothetical protein [Chloroflexota bacterium]
MIERSAPLSGWEVRGDLVCLMCARTIASAQGPRATKFVPTSVKLTQPEHADAVQKMRCPFCTGRLWFQDGEEIYVDRRPLNAEDLRPRRGRPPKVRPSEPAARAS